MKKIPLVEIALGIFFLFLIQMAGTLVESIYILDLMNTSLDEKALGLLFFFSPAGLLVFRKQPPSRLAWVLAGLLILARGLTPYLNTLGRMLSSGIGTGAALALIPFLMTSRAKENSSRLPGYRVSAGFALGVGLSVLLRTANWGLDYSLLPEGGWSGWGLGIGLGVLLTRLDWNNMEQARHPSRPLAAPVGGIFLVVGLAWFAFSAPAVIARWTEGDYRLVVIAISLLSLGWVYLSSTRPSWIKEVSPAWLLIWNLLFALSLVLTILAHRVPFPRTPDSPAVVSGAASWLQGVPLVALLALFPVMFLDLQVLIDRIRQADPEPRDLVPGTLLGSFALVLLVFTQIFSNVWGYIEPVSPWFRNKFWLPYLLMAGLLTALIGRKGRIVRGQGPEPEGPFAWGWAAFLALVFLGTALSALITTRVKVFEPRKDSILVMTYNIQQANDEQGERSYQEQLALIRQVQPDILALQESDSARVSLNNNDYVRYYAGKLGYYSYYGPKTVTGSFGTAILSRYPLQKAQTAFTYSDQDEIGTSEAEVEIGGKLFTIYNVHPDGSDTAMLVWAESLLERSQDKTNLIALGDYNLRDDEQAYQLLARSFTNAWESVYPSKISPDGTDMSGDNRIDHIFFSPSLLARDPVYILPPESATDHPVHWAEIYWK